jgi:hypothetical protein
VHEARQLAAVRAASLAQGGGSVELPLLLFSQVRKEVDKVVRIHNAEPGHDYQGHGTRTEAEVAPGVWAHVGYGGDGGDDDTSN